MNSNIINSIFKLPKTDCQTISSLLLDKLKECYEQTVIVDCETGRKWTGEEVYESALNLAYYLIAECLLRPGDIVCFLCSDSDIHLISFLAVLAAGGVYCALPSHSTYREIDSALTLIEPSFLVTDSFNYGIAATITTEMMSIKKLFIIDEKSASDLNTNLDIFENIFQFERSFLPLPVDGSFADTCALVITSSGDGSPVAVIQTNRNLISSTLSMENSDCSNLTSDDTVLISGLYSNTGLRMFLHTISCGSTVAIFDYKDRSDYKFSVFIDKYLITSALLTTSQLYFYVNNKKTVNQLKNVWFTGTSLTEQTYNLLLKLFKNFWIVFSKPETGWVTTTPLSKLINKTNHKTIGRPMAGVEIKLIDSIGQSVPFNTVGEVCVRSYQTCPGYLNNDMASGQLLMADRFVKTGEYGLYDSDGFFYIVGHSEEYIKVDDFMVAAEELESILNSFIDVKEAAVIYGEDENGSEFVKALVTLNKDHQINMASEQTAPEELLRQFVNIRVEPRKRIGKGGIDIMKESPHPRMRRFSFKKRDEQYV